MCRGATVDTILAPSVLLTTATLIAIGLLTACVHWAIVAAGSRIE